MSGVFSELAADQLEEEQIAQEAQNYQASLSAEV